MRSGAGARPREPDARGGMATGQSQPPLPPLSDRTPGGCPRAALVGPAYFHTPPPLPARAALSHRLEMRDPGPGPRREAAALGCARNCALARGLRCVLRGLGKGRLGGRRVWSLHGNPPQPRIPSRPRARPEEGLEAGALDIRRERSGCDSASPPGREWGYNYPTSSIGLGLPAFRRLPSRPFISPEQP